MELADVPDSKSGGRDIVSVRPRSPAPKNPYPCGTDFFMQFAKRELMIYTFGDDMQDYALMIYTRSCGDIQCTHCITLVGDDALTRTPNLILREPETSFFGLRAPIRFEAPYGIPQNKRYAQANTKKRPRGLF